MIDGAARHRNATVLLGWDSIVVEGEVSFGGDIISWQRLLGK